MGDFVKKWMAGIGAAAVVTVIAVIAIGKMERKSAPAQSSSVGATQAAQSPSMTPPGAQLQAAKQSLSTMDPSGATSGQQAAEIHSESSHAASSPKPSAKIMKSQPSASASKPVANDEVLPAAAGTSVPASTPSTVPMQTQVAQSQPPAAPPDTATASPQTVPTPAATQVSQAEGMNVTGNVNVNGEFSKISRLVYPNDQVFTPGQNGALVTARQNAIALGATTQFKPDSMNSFQIDAGASNVSTKTGMTAKVKDWRVEPVHPEESTQYEVNYESDGVYVYARVNDVDVINDICHRSIRVEQGKVIRIPSARGCAVTWVNSEVRTLPYRVVWGTAAGAGTGVLIWIATHQERPNLSPP